MKKKIKILAQENNKVRLLGKMMNASALSVKNQPLQYTETFYLFCTQFFS